VIFNKNFITTMPELPPQTYHEITFNSNFNLDNFSPLLQNLKSQNFSFEEKNKQNKVENKAGQKDKSVFTTNISNPENLWTKDGTPVKIPERINTISQNEDVVFADISQGRVHVVRQGKVIFSALVVFGASNSPTITGDFRMQSKLVNYKMPAHPEYINFSRFLVFSGNYGFHSYPMKKLESKQWQDEKVTNYNYLSGGCGRMTRQAVDKLAEFVKVGTRVIVQK
jgi:lipoprotein-anchoring transpeptidase ErfK/SrfK